MTTTLTHGELINAIRLALSDVGAMSWPNNTGAVKVGDRFIRYGHPGSHDILGVLPGGTALGVEAKVGQDTVKKHQNDFHVAFAKRGGVSIVARSVDDVLQHPAIAALVKVAA